MAIDFTPITSAPNYASERKTVETSGKQKAKVIYLLLIIPIFWIPLIIYALSKIPAAIKQQKQRDAALIAFAAANNFQYSATRTVQTTQATYVLPYDATPYQPMNVMNGSILNLSFEYVNAGIEIRNYTGPSASDDPASRTMNIFRVQLPITMPELFADSKFNNIFGFNIKVNKFEHLQKIVLEGDFPKYYDILAERNTQIDVLSVLSPEVMVALENNFHYDLWIHGNELMLITGASEIEYFAAIPLIFTNIEVLLQQIDKIATAIRHGQNTA